MKFDFPSNPVVGQVYQPVAGTSYKFDGSCWRVNLSDIPLIISDTPPTNVSQGQLWWQSDTGGLYVYYIDIDSPQWVQIGGSTGYITEAPLDTKQYARKQGNWAVVDVGWVQMTQAAYDALPSKDPNKLYAIVG